MYFLPGLSLSPGVEDPDREGCGLTVSSPPLRPAFCSISSDKRATIIQSVSVTARLWLHALSPVFTVHEPFLLRRETEEEVVGGGMAGQEVGKGSRKGVGVGKERVAGGGAVASLPRPPISFRSCGAQLFTARWAAAAGWTRWLVCPCVENGPPPETERAPAGRQEGAITGKEQFSSVTDMGQEGER